MKSASSGRNPVRYEGRLRLSWILLCLAIILHVLDEAKHDFLSVYNPSVMVLRQSLPWLPLPTFSFRQWITGLAVGIALLFSLLPFLSRGARWTRPLVFVVSVLMIANGLGHIAGTILGRTAAAIHFPRPMPGFYSSPILIAASLYVLMQLRNTKQARKQM